MKQLITLWLFLMPVFCISYSYGQSTSNKTGGQNQFDRPNVVIIMADDLGYGDLTYFGGDTKINMPNIDSLTTGGLKLTNFHSNGVVCSSTRASLVTGLYPQEAGIEGVVTARSHRDTGMKPEKYTIAELFENAGYQTALFGKWHLGYQPKFGPVVQGFDHFRGFVSGNIDYKSHIDQEGYADWWKRKELKTEEGYLTNLITDHGIKFIKHNQSKPFFLYLAHGAPHYPYQGPDDPAERTVHGDFKIQGSRKDVVTAYDEMIASLDRNVGRVMSSLKEQNLLKNTLVIFCSDNGASPAAGSNAPFRGHKGQVYEGGHHVPAVWFWQGTISPGVSDELVLSMDVLPTIAEILEIDLNSKTRVSGKNMASLIYGDQKKSVNEEVRTVFWRFHGQKAALKGKWKLLLQNGESALYNLSEDIDETEDVKSNNPEIFQELKKSLQQWESNLEEEIRS